MNESYGTATRENARSDNSPLIMANAFLSQSCHMIQPDLEDGAGFSAMNIKGSGYTKLAEILHHAGRTARRYTASDNRDPMLAAERINANA